MLIKLGGQVDCRFTRPYDQIVWPRLDKVHNLECVWLDLAGVDNVPHEVAIWEDNDRSCNPIVVNQEVTILQAENFHITVESLMRGHFKMIKLILESFPVEFGLVGA